MKTHTGTFILVGAALLAGPALAQSAQVNSSGAVIAAERTAPGPDRATSVSRGEMPADEPTSDNSTRVRAPAVTYLYESSNRDHIDQDAQDAQVDHRRPSSRDQAPGSTSGESQQGGLRIINNSESETARVVGQNRAGQSETPVNGIGGTGGGRYTFNPTQRSTSAPTPSNTPGSTGDAEPIFDRWGQRRGSDNAGEGPARTSNRDHIDQDAQIDQRSLPSRDQVPGSTSRGIALTEVSSSQGADFIARTNTDRPPPGGRRQVPGAGSEAAITSSRGPIDMESWSWGRIDRLNTAEACTARRGVVLIHEGVQQCRLPSTSRQEGAVRP